MGLIKKIFLLPACRVCHLQSSNYFALKIGITGLSVSIVINPIKWDKIVLGNKTSLFNGARATNQNVAEYI